VCGAGGNGRRKISFGGGAGGSGSDSGSWSAAGSGASVGVGEVSLRVLRRAGELRVRVRRAAGYWWKDGETDIKTSSARTAIVGDLGSNELRGEVTSGAVAGGVGGRG